MSFSTSISGPRGEVGQGARVVRSIDRETKLTYPTRRKRIEKQIQDAQSESESKKMEVMLPDAYSCLIRRVIGYLLMRGSRSISCRRRCRVDSRDLTRDK